jgi:hypothetical protein
LLWVHALSVNNTVIVLGEAGAGTRVAVLRLGLGLWS